MQRTGLTVEFSLQCLDMNRWDIESAVASFEAAKVNILLLKLLREMLIPYDSLHRQPTLPRIAFLPFLFK